MINWLAKKAQNDEFYIKTVNIVPFIVFGLIILVDMYTTFDIFFLGFAGLLTLYSITLYFLRHTYTLKPQKIKNDSRDL